MNFCRMRREQSEMFRSAQHDSNPGVLAVAKRSPGIGRCLLGACPSRRSRNPFFRDFLRLAHRINVAASVVGLCRRGARLEVGKHLCVSALSAGGAIEFCQ